MSTRDNAAWLKENFGPGHANDYEEAHANIKRALEELRKLSWVESSRALFESLEAGVKEIDDTLTAVVGHAEELEETNENQADACDLVAEALEDLREDRKALLAKLGLTDFAWASQGGHCEANFDEAILAAEKLR